ncbi:RHS repeat-associated core domain-containing protein [Planctomycetota bacterium]
MRRSHLLWVLVFVQAILSINFSAMGGTIGDTAVLSGITYASNRRAMPYTMTEDGDLQSISMYHQGGSGNMILAVYSNNGGVPANRLATTASTTLNTSPGWQTISLSSPVSVTAGETIWLTWVYQYIPGIRYTYGTPGRVDAGVGWSGGMPSTFGSASQAGYIYSIYATYTTTPDVTAPGAVTGLTATAGDGQVSLSWTNPGDADLTGVKILRKTGSPSNNPTDGAVVYDGLATSTLDMGLTNGTLYYYTAFSYDEVPNYSVGVSASAMPQYIPIARIGDETVFSGITYASNRRAMRYTMTENGNLQSISMYHQGGSGNMILAVYSDSGGSPANRLATTASTALNTSAGWQTISLSSPVSVAAGETIWLTWVYENIPGIRFVAGTPGRVDAGVGWSGGMPSTFGYAAVANYIYSIYATYAVEVPTVESFSPADDSIAVSVDMDLVIDFSETVQKGTGAITIKQSSDHAVFETIAVTSGQVTVSGDIVTINPSADLSPQTEYYIQIDSGAFNDLSGNPYAGITNSTTWNFTTETAPIPPDPATNPVPADVATEIPIDADINWTAGAGATSHDVYFGTNPSPGTGEFQGNQTGMTFDPGTLANDTTYYWRIDEKNADGTTTGVVWSFTTEAAAPVQSLLPGYRASLAATPAAASQLRTRIIQGGSSGANQLPHPDEIAELARGLRYNPGDIYKMVHDYVAYELTWGDVKGAYMTWMDRSGNAFDQASLMIALLEEAALHNTEMTISNPRYVVGEIEITTDQAEQWLGLPSTDAALARKMLARGGLYGNVFTYNVNLMHVWVQVTIDGIPYEFDPSFKEHESTSGLTNAQFEAALGYNRSDFYNRALSGATTSATAVEDLHTTNIATDLVDFSSNLADYIRLNHCDATLAEIIGGKTIKPADISDLPPTNVPYTISTRDELFASFSVPELYRTLLSIQHEGIDKTYFSSDVYGRRLTLSYNASNEPELRLEGMLEATGNSTTAGQAYDLTLSVDHPFEITDFDDSQVLSVISGGFYTIANGWGDTDTKILAKHRENLLQLQYQGIPDSSESVLGEAYSVVGFTWLAQMSKLLNLARWVGDRDTVSPNATYSVVNHHLLGVVGEYGQPIIDIPMGHLGLVSITDTDATEGMFRALAGHANAYQHTVLRQLQDGEAISAVKLFDMANARTSANQLFKADSANWSSIQTQLQDYSQAEIDLVSEYINAGYEVYLPEYGDLSQDNWTGTGFSAYQESSTMLSAGYLVGSRLCGASSAVTASLDSDVLAERCYDPPLGKEGVGQGAYTHGHTDLGVGSGSLPFGLSFGRSYSSQRRLEDGPLGLGWTHNFDIRTKVLSDSFQMLGEDSAVEAAPQVATLYVVMDLLRSSATNDLAGKITTALAESWLMDQMVDNLVLLFQEGGKTRFTLLPDGHYEAPPAAKLRLTLQANDTFRLKNAAGKFYDFDTDGTISQWSDQFGNVVDFTYSNQKLTDVTCRIGGVDPSWAMSFTYTGERITTVTDSASRSISLGYDALGQLTSYTNADANTASYVYDTTEAGLFTELWRPTDVSPYTTVNYDTLGRIEQIVDANNDEWDSYYADFRSETLEPAQIDPDDPNGPRKRYSVKVWSDNYGLPILTIDQLGRQSTAEYNGLFKPTQTISAFGTSAQFSYIPLTNDPNIVVTEEVHSLCRPGSPLSDPNTSASSTYNSFVNAAGRWFVVAETSTDANGYVTTHTYNTGNGTLTQTTYPQVDPGIDPTQPVVSFTYTSYGQLETTTDAEGLVSKLEYYPAASGGALKKTIDDYGDASHLNITSEITYNSAGQVLTATDPKGNTAQNQYSTGGRLMKTISPAPFNYETTNEYDADGKLLFVKQYTTQGAVVLQAVTYNARGQQATVRGPYPEGTTDPNEYNTNYTQYFYDTLGRTVKVIDAEGHATKTYYYPDGKAWKTVNAEGFTVTTNTYNSDGTLAQVQDANDNATSYEYNGFGALKKTLYADDSYTEPGYDSVRRLATQRTRKGDTITLVYDGLHRTKTQQVSGTGGYTYSYTYDLCGRTTTVSKGSDTITSQFDSAGRLIQVTDAANRTTAYQYDLNGNRTSLTYPDSSTITYTYDQLNRPTQILDPYSTVLADYTYDERSRRTQLTYANGTTTSYDYDAASRLLSIDSQTDNNQHKYAYTYDDVGNRLTMLVNDTDTHTYQYDDIYQITEVDYPPAYNYLSGDTSYSYDKVGNRTTVVDGETAHYVTNNLNQYISVDGTPFTYDDNGNLTQDIDNVYTYDPENRLIEVRKVVEPEVLLQEATDSELSFATGGDANWVKVTDVYYTGDPNNDDSAYCGDLQSGESSWMKAIAYGSGNMTFRVKHETEGYWRFKTDGTQQILASGATTWSERGPYAVQGFGLHVFEWDYNCDNGGALWVDQIEWNEGVPWYQPTLSAALDTDFDIQCAGNFWQPNSTTTPVEGTNCARSGYTEDKWVSQMDATIQGEGRISFYWKVSSQENSDFLEVFIDGIKQDSISGEVPWEEKTFTLIGEGEHHVLWQYSKDSSGSGGDDYGWVDNLHMEPGAPGSPDFDLVTYAYDAAGRRITKNIDGTITQFTYDGGHVLAEYDGSNNLLRKYIYGPGVDSPICMIETAENNAAYYYHTDGIGNVVALSDDNGDTVQTYEYTLFGQVAASDVDHPNPYMFTGRRFDLETGLYYYRARMYDPHTGRFLQTDPVGYSDGINWYAYCGNNPGNMADPSGCYNEGVDEYKRETRTFATWDDYLACIRGFLFSDFEEQIAAKTVGMTLYDARENWNPDTEIEIVSLLIFNAIDIAEINGFCILTDRTLNQILSLADSLGKHATSFNEWNQETFRYNGSRSEWARVSKYLEHTVTVFDTALRGMKWIWTGISYHTGTYGSIQGVPYTIKEPGWWQDWGTFGSSSINWILFGHAARKIGVSRGLARFFCDSYNFQNYYHLGGKDVFWAMKGWDEYTQRDDW